MNIRLNTFCTGQVTRDELEQLVSETIEEALPGAKILVIYYNDTGMLIETDLGDVELEIDWNEIILKE